MTAGNGSEELWKEFHERLLTFIRRRVSSETDAEDILQEVFLRIHRSAERLPEVESTSGWVYKITRNAIIDHYRARASADGLTEGAAKEWASQDRGQVEPASEESSREAGIDPSRCVRALVESLPEPYGEAVAMTELEGVTQREAAQRLGISVSGMKSRVQRGRGKLKNLLVECCTWELDGRGAVLDIERREDDGCGPECACQEDDPPPAG